MLIALDRAAGGRSQFSKTEFRRCEMCARPLIGLEAETLRRFIESGPLARTLPCGPDCARDRELKTWKNLARGHVRLGDEAALPHRSD
jgi:hypothetical protein